jgi:UDP-glucose 4-epimerase
MKRVLVVGGAGYVGGATVWALHREGYSVCVLDDLSSGNPEGLPPGVEVVQASTSDHAALLGLLQGFRPSAVLHFAASIQVGESVQHPLKYLSGNVAAGMSVFQAMLDVGVRKLVVSSSASVYAPSGVPLSEDAPTGPASPYGEAKLYLERAVSWMAAAHGWEAASLRYFNAAGALESRGEEHHPETHLIPRILEVAAGQSPVFGIYGGDYPTPDGTCVRDFVHVADIADAHVRMLAHLRPGHRIYNVGTGRGSTVREVVRTAERVTGRQVAVRVNPRRPGDPPFLVANSDRLRKETGWSPSRSSLEEIVRDAWSWKMRSGDR